METMKRNVTSIAYLKEEEQAEEDEDEQAEEEEQAEQSEEEDDLTVVDGEVKKERGDIFHKLTSFF